MKVLLLPVNIASDISHKVRALRSIGIDARGLSVYESSLQAPDGVELIPIGRGLRGRVRRLAAMRRIWEMIEWADVLHWVSDANVFSQRRNFSRLQRLNKPGVIQWTGSDIRIPEIDFAVNPYYRQAFNHGYEYVESHSVSIHNQRFAAKLGFYPLDFIGMGQYIDDGLFPNRFRTWQPVLLADHTPSYPDGANVRPLIVHSPSAPGAKGTKHVVRAIESLQGRFDFEFRLVQNTKRSKALELMQSCDIYVDQLILGAHGYAAVEAMAFGKPVVCYINPEIGKDYPPDLPIVNANPDDIESKLEELLVDANLRNEIGRKGREYAEKYHDDRRIADELAAIYREVIALTPGRGEN